MSSGSSSISAGVEPKSTPITSPVDQITAGISNVRLDDSHRAVKLLGLLNPSNKLKYHDLLETDYLSDFQSELEKPSKIKVHVVTWNLCQRAPGPGIEKLVALEDGGVADLYVFSFQETVSLRSFSHSEPVIQQWVGALQKHLPADYVCVHTNGLLGLTTILIASPEVASQISDVKVETVGLGYLRWYNKGAISVKFRLGKFGDSKLSGLAFQLFNIHLVHGEDDSSSSARTKSLQKVGNTISLVNESAMITKDSNVAFTDTVVRSIDLSEVEKKKLTDGGVFLDGIAEESAVRNGAILLSGDLNYRISGLSSKDIVSEAENHDFDALTANDELTRLTKDGSVFVGFSERAIEFAPTYKVKDATQYDSKRRPAYTDRIFYCGSQISQTSYTSVPLTGSDHVPVTADYIVDAPLYNVDLMKKRKDEFEAYYQRVIETMPLLEITPDDIKEDVCAELEEVYTFTFKNLSDEDLTYKLIEPNKSFFRGGAFQIDNDGTPLPAQSDRQIHFAVKPLKVGPIIGNYTVQLAGFPKFNKSFSITLNTKAVSGVPVDDLTEEQYQNISDCFDFVIGSDNKFGLTKHLDDAEGVDTLTPQEKVILEQITLSKVDFATLKEKNNFGNAGSIAVIDVLHMWMKLLPEVNIGSARGKAVFSQVIDLIRFLGLDHEEAFEYFGFLFTDPYEVLDYMESSVK